MTNANSTRSIVRRLSLSLLFSILPASVSGTIIGGEVTGGMALKRGGVFVKLTVPFDESTPPNTVGKDNFQSFNLYGFDEGQNIELPQELKVDVLGDGQGGNQDSGVLPQGLVVASHYVCFDPPGGSQTGTVTFDSPVIAILTRTNTQAASDFLINNGVNYLNPGPRGLEGGDKVTITGTRTIHLKWAATSPGDCARVLTLFSPGAESMNRRVDWQRSSPGNAWVIGPGVGSAPGSARM